MYSSEELERFVLCVHGATSEVWLRTCVEPSVDEGGNEVWTALEKRVELGFPVTAGWVEENFDRLLADKPDPESIVAALGRLGEEVAEQSAAICEIYEMLIGEE